MPISSIPTGFLPQGIDGPSSSVDNEITRFNGSTGKTIKGTSGATILVSGNTLEFNRGLQSQSYNCYSSDMCHISSRPTDQTEANPNIITINSVNFGTANNGGYISVNSQFDGFPNWTQTSASATTTAQFIRLAPEKLEVRFGNATNTEGTSPGTEVLTCEPTQTTFNNSLNFKTIEVTTATYNIIAGDYHIMVNRPSASSTLTLPVASSTTEGQVFKVTDVSGNAYSVGSIIIDQNGSDLINGQTAPFIMDIPYQSVEIILHSGKWYITSIFDRNKGNNLVRAELVTSFLPMFNLLDEIDIQFTFEDTTVSATPLLQLTVKSSDTDLRFWYSGHVIVASLIEFQCPSLTGFPLSSGDTLAFSNIVTETGATSYFGIETALNLLLESSSVFFNNLEILIESGPYTGRRIFFTDLRVSVSNNSPPGGNKSIAVYYSWRGQ